MHEFLQNSIYVVYRGMIGEPFGWSKHKMKTLRDAQRGRPKNLCIANMYEAKFFRGHGRHDVLIIYDAVHGQS